MSGELTKRDSILSDFGVDECIQNLKNKNEYLKHNNDDDLQPIIDNLERNKKDYLDSVIDLNNFVERSKKLILPIFEQSHPIFEHRHLFWRFLNSILKCLGTFCHTKTSKCISLFKEKLSASNSIVISQYNSQRLIEEYKVTNEIQYAKKIEFRGLLSGEPKEFPSYADKVIFVIAHDNDNKYPKTFERDSGPFKGYNDQLSNFKGRIEVCFLNHHWTDCEKKGLEAHIKTTLDNILLDKNKVEAISFSYAQKRNLLEKTFGL